MPTSSANDTHAECVVEIRNPEGLHMRPAMQMVDCANRFVSNVTIAKGARQVDGKSIMQVSTLVATCGTKLKIVASGKDASDAIKALQLLMESHASGDEKDG